MLGTQGLWPGRRWKGLEGAREALSTCRLVRVDPVDVIGRTVPGVSVTPDLILIRVTAVAGEGPQR